MRHLSLVLSCAIVTVLAAAPGFAETPQQWYRDGAKAAREGATLRGNERPAKNIILFVGDGMGVSTVSAARILEGQLKGLKGEEHSLSFERFPYLSLSKTYSVDGQTADSAPTMTAMMSGIKTNQGVINVTQSARYNDCASAQGKGVATLLEFSEAMGLATGVVSTARITHATPAATFAHTPNRDWESDAELTAEAKANGCKDIASQLIDFPFGDGIEVALGGGRSYFLPNTTNDPEDAGAKGRRKDGRNLTTEWMEQPQSAFVWNKAQFDAIDPRSTR
ncbi:MAG TPA: alkaline phosphatase, partial [Lysobacter sp.]|nr:alkaline phosphatase [Lysobacter sp.]